MQSSKENEKRKGERGSRGQSSIEMLALTALFVSLLVPLVLFLFSSSTQLSERGSLEGVRNTLFVLKEKIEYAYAYCPYRERFLLSIPSNVEEITAKDGYLLAITSQGEIVESLAVDGRVEVNLKGGAFSRPVEVVCERGVEPVVEVRPA